MAHVAIATRGIVMLEGQWSRGWLPKKFDKHQFHTHNLGASSRFEQCPRVVTRPFLNIVILVLMTLWSPFVVAQTNKGDVQLSPISGSPDQPRRHFRLRHPAELKAEEARRVYGLISSALKAAYAVGEDGRFKDYQRWQKYNTAPYLSSTHGNHYLNNYANDIATAYGDFEQAGTMPVGSVIAKDSFSVTQSREILLGPLYVMVKMPEGFNYVTGDWKYIQVQPDGSLHGETLGSGADGVDYCIGCHLAKADQDHLYFIPPDYRSKD